MPRPYQQQAVIKVCSKCKTDKDIIFFGIDKRSSDGIRNVCKECRKIETKNRKEIQSKINKEYYKNNKEAENFRSKQYQVLNKEKISQHNKEKYKINQNKYLEISKQYRLENLEIANQRTKNWRLKNPEKIINYSKDYYEKNKKTMNQKKQKYNKKRMLSDEFYKLKINIRSRFKTIIKREMKKSWRDCFLISQYSFEDYVNYFNKTQPDLFLKYRQCNEYAIDHIIPVSAYDFSDMDEIMKCWNPLNLRITTHRENNIKKDKLDIDLIKKHNITHLLPKGIIIND